MASYLELIDQQKHDVWSWRRREDDAVHAVQAARRAYERSHHSPEKHAVRETEHTLLHVRHMLNAAEEKLDHLRASYDKLNGLEKSENYWIDRVQDLHREVIRCVKIVQRLRREEESDRSAARGEIALAESLVPGVKVDFVPDATESLGDEFEAHTGTVLGDALVFTNKAQLTAAEQRLVYVKGLWHHAQAVLKKVRTKMHPPEPSGGSAEAVVHAARECAQHSGSYHYSQGGSWRMGYFPGGEPWGIRSDCSQFVTKCFYHAQARDPNGMGYGGGYTGTLGAHGTRVSSPRAGDLCLVGNYPYHHVELVVDSNGNTIGHGDARVDGSSIYNYSPRTLRRYL
jgi:hypothetical protein